MRKPSIVPSLSDIASGLFKSLRSNSKRQQPSSRRAKVSPPQQHSQSAAGLANVKFRTFSWGDGSEGKLGHGNYESFKSPSRIQSLDGCNVLGLAAGAQHSVAIISPPGDAPELGGYLYGWGSNFYGQAGYMNDMARNTSMNENDEEDAIEVPSLVKAVTYDNLSKRMIAQDQTESNIRFRAAKCGNFHTAALAVDGTVWTWGAGVLGHGSELYESTAMQVRFFNDIGRTIKSVHAAGYLTIVNAEKNRIGDQGLANNYAPPEVYIWGYMIGADLKRQKALSPVLVADVVKSLQHVTGVYAFRNGMFGVVGVEKDSPSNHLLRIYGVMDPFLVASNEASNEVPSYPMYEECDEIKQVYSYDPQATIKLSTAKLSADDVLTVEMSKEFGVLLTRSGTLFSFTLPKNGLCELTLLQTICTETGTNLTCHTLTVDGKGRAHISAKSGTLSFSNLRIFTAALPANSKVEAERVKCDVETATDHNIILLASGYSHYLAFSVGLLTRTEPDGYIGGAVNENSGDGVVAQTKSKSDGGVGDDVQHMLQHHSHWLITSSAETPAKNEDAKEKSFFEIFSATLDGDSSGGDGGGGDD